MKSAGLGTHLHEPDCDVTVVVRTFDDEEYIGHLLSRIARHLRALGLRFELIVADEGSGDNTLAVAALLRPTVPELQLLHTASGHGYFVACQRARGRAILLCDARTEAPLSPLGFALERLRQGHDIVALEGRYLIFRRTRAWRAFEALIHRRGPRQLERFVRRARALGLVCTEIKGPPRLPPWMRLRLLLGLRLGTA